MHDRSDTTVVLDVHMVDVTEMQGCFGAIYHLSDLDTWICFCNRTVSTLRNAVPARM